MYLFVVQYGPIADVTSLPTVMVICGCLCWCGSAVSYLYLPVANPTDELLRKTSIHDLSTI